MYFCSIYPDSFHHWLTIVCYCLLETLSLKEVVQFVDGGGEWVPKVLGSSMSLRDHNTFLSANKLNLLQVDTTRFLYALPATGWYSLSNTAWPDTVKWMPTSARHIQWSQSSNTFTLEVCTGPLLLTRPVAILAKLSPARPEFSWAWPGLAREAEDLLQDNQSCSWNVEPGEWWSPCSAKQSWEWAVSSAFDWQRSLRESSTVPRCMERVGLDSYSANVHGPWPRQLRC